MKNNKKKKQPQYHVREEIAETAIKSNYKCQ